MGEVELFEVEFRGCNGTEFVERGEEPAAAAAALVGNAPDIDAVLEIIVQPGVGKALRESVDIGVVGNDVLKRHGSRILDEAALDGLQFILSDRLCHGCH